MTTPALLRLREKFPAAHITLLTPEKLADLWRHHPNIDSVITFTAGESLLSVALKLRSLNPKRFDELPEVLPGDTLARVFARVTNILSASAFDGRLGFDLALILPNSPRSALEVWLAGIPWRIGYASPWRNWFLTEAVPARAEAVKMRKRSVGEIKQLIRGTGFQPVPPLNAHQMHEYLHLAGALGANPEPLPPQLVVTPDEIEAVKKKFGLKEIERPIFGLNPGAEYGPAKRWPVESFIAAGIALRQATRCRWIIFGGPADGEIAHIISTGLGQDPDGQPAINLAGQTTLRELAAALKSCRLLLTNDSGPMHLAAAVGTPVVVPFGSTSPEMTGPTWSAGAQILRAPGIPCSPCFRRDCPIDLRCMTGITSEAVVAAAITAATAEAAMRAAFTAWTLRGGGGLRRRGVDRMHGNDLKPARRFLQIADDRCALRQIWCAECGQRGGVTECIAAVFKRDETVSFGRVEPLDRALHRSLGEGPVTIVEVCHGYADAAPAGNDPRARWQVRQPHQCVNLHHA